MKRASIKLPCIIGHIYVTLIAATASPQLSQFFPNGTQSAGIIPIAGRGQGASAKVFNQRFNGNDQNLDEAKMTTVEIISSRGYPVEVHKVVTEDGYILELHRIPFGKWQVPNPNVKKQPVYLQHGFLNSDNVWLLTPNNKALAYILADTGLYDVWLGNARGNTYSREHVNLDTTQEAYWDFSFDEMGNYDIPAVINFVLAKTGRSTMSYIGIKSSNNFPHLLLLRAYSWFKVTRWDVPYFLSACHCAPTPELNAKIDVMIALAPATSLAEAETSIRYQAPFVNQLLIFFRIFGIRIYEPVDSPSNNFRKTFCGPNLILRYSVCRNTIFSTTSDNYRNIDVNLLPVIDGHNPAGTSVRTAAHFAQNYNAGQTFQRYDFGSSENQQRYGQATPPAYDLSKVTVPVHIFWGENDKAVAPGDVAWLASKLGNPESFIRIEDPEWNHSNFLFATHAKQLVYDKFVPLLPKAS